VKKLLSGELLRIETDQHGVSFFPQHSQTLRAFLPWEEAFKSAMEPKTAIAQHQGPTLNDLINAQKSASEVLEFPRIVFAEDDGA
jgi:hypothetical protein